VLPAFSFGYQADSGAAHSKLFRKSRMTYSAISEFPDLSYLFFGELCGANLLAFNLRFVICFSPMSFTLISIAAFVLFIAHVIRVRALPKVIGTDATAMSKVAYVTDIESRIKFVRVCDRVSDAVRLALAPLQFQIEMAVTSSIFAAGPDPAVAVRPMAGRFVDFIPEVDYLLRSKRRDVTIDTIHDAFPPSKSILVGPSRLCALRRLVAHYSAFLRAVITFSLCEPQLSSSSAGGAGQVSTASPPAGYFYGESS
jgi:glycerol-3-phosphate cytidylyltransferase-like family protein